MISPRQPRSRPIPPSIELAEGGPTTRRGGSGASDEFSPQSFYDRLSPFYHLIYDDWEASVERQGAELAEIVAERWGEGPKEILDVACGIGTQTVGLAERGHRLTGSDVAPRALERAREEIRSRGLEIDLQVAPMERVHDHHARQFDLVMACDNAVPHLLSDEAIAQAFGQFYRATRPGGGVVLSVRDYTAMELGGSQVHPYGMRTVGTTRYLIFQVWDFPVDDILTLGMYFVVDEGGELCQTHVGRTRYYAVSIDRLMELLRQAGFERVERIDGRFFQPVLVGTRPAAR